MVVMSGILGNEQPLSLRDGGGKWKRRDKEVWFAVGRDLNYPPIQRFQ